MRMQREIKFRAWHSEFAEMVYSSDETLWEKREFYPFCIPVGFSHYPTEQWDLMQYTGIKDKNGKEIYEGDIVKYNNNTCVVYWEYAGFRIKPLPNTSITSHIELEIIGNIYENSELLNENIISK